MRYSRGKHPNSLAILNKRLGGVKKGHGWPEGYHEKQSIAQKKRFMTERQWNTGLRASTKRSRRSDDLEYAKHCEWRKKVFLRDNYTCQKCNKRGVEIQADHIKMWALYPELRYDLDNGQTLCKSCHAEKTAIELSIYWKNQYKQSAHYEKVV